MFMRVLTEKIRKITHTTQTNDQSQNIHAVDARVHYTVLTQHPTPPIQPTTTATITGSHSLLAWCEHQDQPTINGLLSQTPNSAPTNYLEKLLPVYASKNSCYQPLYGWRC